MRLGTAGWRIHFLPVLPVLAAAALIFTGTRLSAAFSQTARAYANNAATSAVSEAVYDVFSNEDDSYTNARSVDRATVLTTDTARVNMLNSQLAERIQNSVLEHDYTTAYIPLGSITGIAAFSGRGFKIPVKLHPISLVNADFDEQFESCGINQVRHTVLLNVEIVMAYSAYLFADSETVKVSVPVTDAVIVGDTPEYYGGGEFFAGNEVKQ